MFVETVLWLSRLALAEFICLNVWGATLLPLNGLHLWGMAGDEDALMKRKVPSWWTRWTPALHLTMSMQPNKSSAYPLQELSTITLTGGCGAVGCWQPLSSLSCWFPWPRVQGCVLACPIQAGPLPKMVANSPCGLTDRHVVELSLWNM